MLIADPYRNVSNAIVNTLPQRIKKIGSLRYLGLILLGKRATFHLCLDQFGKGSFITVIEFGRVEAAFLCCNDVFCKFKHFTVNLECRDIRKGFFCRLHFVVAIRP